MTFAAELDDRRQEARRGYASNPVYFWPKVAGLGNVFVASSPAPTFATSKPDGAAIASGSATVATFDGVTRLGVTIDASGLELDENYACHFTWTYDGLQHVDTVRFDVVREPYDGSDVSLNDLLDELAELRELLEGQAQAHGSARSIATTAAVSVAGVVTFTVAAGHGLVPGNMITVSGHDAAFNTSTAVAIQSVTETTIVAAIAGSGSATSVDTTGTISAARTAEQQASLLAMKAAGDVKSWIRARLEAKGRVFPRLFVDRNAIRQIVIAQTIARAYRAQGGGAESPSRARFDEWTGEAHARLANLGMQDYDDDDDGIPDTVFGGFSVVKIGRSWT